MRYLIKKGENKEPVAKRRNLSVHWRSQDERGPQMTVASMRNYLYALIMENVCEIRQVQQWHFENI